MTQRNERFWPALGAVWVAMGIAVGAVGVHILEARGLAEGAERWALAGRYAAGMGVGLVALSALRAAGPLRGGVWPERLMNLGLLGFAGGLLVKGVVPDSPLGAIIPYGGTLLIVAWIWAAGQILSAPTRPHT